MSTRYMIVSGFLGSGKTTTMIAMAREMNRRMADAGKDSHAAIIANDLGAKNLVDADYTRMADVDISEITGDCICYVTEDLITAIGRLASAGADIVISDIPGAGVGALEHVYMTLEEEYPGRFDLLPLTCLVDPMRLRMILPEGERDNINLPQEMRFLLNAQLMEADLIVLNKCDLIDDEERAYYLDFISKAYPDIPVMAMSARTGEGVAELVDYVLSHKAGAEHRDLGLDSEEFDAAEAQMCWYNRRFHAKERNGADIDFNAVIEDIMEGIRDGLIEAKRNVPHLKLFAAGVDDDFVKCSIVGVDYDLEFERKLDRKYTAIAMIINARATCESETFAEIVDDVLDDVKAKYDLKCNIIFTECFGFADEGRRNGARASKY